MDTWILVGNPSTTSTANVDIYIGGVKKGPIASQQAGSITPRFEPAGRTGAGGLYQRRAKIFTSERSLIWRQLQ